MVCGAGKNMWTPPRNSGRIPSTRFFSVSIENEQADKRRYSQTCLAKPNSQARTGARKFSPVQLTINRIGNLTQLICTLLYVMTTHTCIRISRGRHYAKLSLSNAARLSFSDLCILLFMFLSLCRLCVCVFLCSHWSLVDVPLIFFCPADHVPDWQPRVLLGMVEARSVNVKKTTTTTTTTVAITLNSRLLSGHLGV